MTAIVSVAASPASVTENGTTNLTYTFTRTGDTSLALTVNIDLGGTATAADYVTTSLASASEPSKAWTKLLGSSRDDLASALTTGLDGSIYVSGDTEGDLDGQTNSGRNDAFLTKYSADGTKAWTKLLGSSGYDGANALTTGLDGSIYVSGYTGDKYRNGDFDGQTNSTVGGFDAFLTKYSADGTKAWTKLLGSPGSSIYAWRANDRANALTTGLDGSIYVSGYTDGDLDGQTYRVGSSDVFLTKYSADGTKAWTKLLSSSTYDKYDSYNNVQAYALTTGLDGSIYVSGRTYGDLNGQTNSGYDDAFLTKYSSDGTRAWTKLLGSSGSDYAYALTTGLDGSIYVSGDTNGALDGQAYSGGTSDVFLTKYSADGTKAWTKLLGSRSYYESYENAYALTTGIDGSVYVSGLTGGDLDGQTNNGYADAFLTKYSADGTKAWTKLLGSSNYDRANALTTGLDGSIYVSGYTKGALDGQTNSGGDDAFLTKFSVSPQITFAAGSSTATLVIDPTSDNLVEGAETVIVTVPAGTGYTVGTAAVATGSIVDANQTPTYSITSGSNSVNEGSTATFTLTTTNVAVGTLVQYTVSGVTAADITGGVLSGTATVAASGTATIFVLLAADLLTEGAETLTVTAGGASASTTVNDTSLSAVASVSVAVSPASVTESGTTNLTYTFTRTGDTSVGLTVNVNLGGTASAADYAIGTPLASATEPLKVWTKLLGGTGSDRGTALAIGLDGSVYLGGETWSNLDGQSNNGNGDAFITKYAADGTKSWTRLIGGNSNQNGAALATGVDGYIYLGGYTSDGLDGQASIGNADAFITKYDFNGAKVWTRLLGGVLSDVGTALAGSLDSSIYLAGYSQGSIDGQTGGGGDSSAFIAKYDANGLKTWTRLIGGGHTLATSVTVGLDGSGYMGGYTNIRIGGQINNGGSDAFITKYDANGTNVWTRLIGGVNTDQGAALATGLDGSIYLGGYTNDSLDGQANSGGSDAFITKFDASGTKVWTRLVGGAGDEQGTSLTVGSDGAIYLGGSTHSGIDGQTNGGNYDAFITKFDVNGTRFWTRLIGGADNDFGFALAASLDGKVYFGGYTFGAFDGQSNSGPQDAFLTKFSVSPQITFAAGSSSATLVVDPTADSLAEGSETVTVTVLAGTGYTVGTAAVATGSIVDTNQAPTGSVTIGGTATQGQTLTATNTLADGDGLGVVSYQWKSAGVTIGGATSSTLVLTAAQVGKAISVVASYTDGHGMAESVASGVTAAVITNANVLPTGGVTIAGIGTKGQTLTASNSLADADGLGAISYQWKADGVNIASAMGNTLVLTDSQVGKSITVVASFTDGRGTAESITSSATAAILAGNANSLPTGSVTIVGITLQGQTLTAANTLADVDGLGVISYQWKSAGVNIAGTNANSLMLTEAQVGKAITVVASYTDGHGTVEAVTSGASPVVAGVNSAASGSVVIEGTTTQGQTLTASNTLADADGLGSISYQWAAGGSNIAGATANSLVLTEAQVGKAISVVASYVDGHGTGESMTSGATSAVANVNDMPTGGVTITGTVAKGQTLTAANTLADADGLGAIGYQWYAAGVAVAGANSNTLVLTDAQVGKAITVTASYIDGHGTPESITSSASAAVPSVNSAASGSVAISGTVTQGQVLTVTHTLADADGLGVVSYQWQAAGSNIAGATANSLVLTETQVGKAITVTASYTDGRGTAESMTSSATGPVGNVNDSPTGSVTIGGAAGQGQTLTAMNTLADADGLGAISYQWKAAGINISGATASTLLLAEAQVGKTITVAASYTDGHGRAELVSSAETPVVANVNDLPTGSVTITGPATQGQTLTATNTLADADGLGAISYQWTSGGSDISGATGSTLVLTEALVGKAISVVASYTDGHGTAESMTSSATPAVANVNDLPTGAVKINGTAAKGQTLAASSTLADADGLGVISYQWQAAGTAIASATGNTLLLADAQIGKPITVTASYTDGHGTPESITSSASAAVAIANSATASSVTIVGAALQGQTLTATLTLANVDVGLISYQWQVAGTKLSGATGSTLLLTEALVGKTIDVVASYTVLTPPYVEPPTEGPAGAIGDPASLSFLKVKQSVVLATASGAKAAAFTGIGTVESITSSPTSPVANVNDLPTGGVTISGTATQGQTLTAANTLADVDGLGAISYLWKAAGSIINGATASTFLLTEAQVGKVISVVASYTDGHNTAESVASSATASVANVNDRPTGGVTISGSATQGQTLTAANTLADADGLGAIGYQWQADGLPIVGATANTLLLGAAQAGKAISVLAGYLDGRGTAEAVTSLAVQIATASKAIELQAYSWKTHTLLSAVAFGDGSHNGSTDSLGEVKLADVNGATLTASLSPAAATNQDVNLQDAIAILKMIVGLDVNGAGKALSPYQAYAADFDGNGKVELSDAIGVLKHVVGLPAPDVQWLFFNEADASVPGKSSLNPGAMPALTATLATTGATHVGLVGVLRGDVDGSYGGGGSQSLDLAYFQHLAADTGLNLTQFGVYGP